MQRCLQLGMSLTGKSMPPVQPFWFVCPVTWNGLSTQCKPLNCNFYFIYKLFSQISRMWFWNCALWILYDRKVNIKMSIGVLSAHDIWLNKIGKVTWNPLIKNYQISASSYIKKMIGDIITSHLVSNRTITLNLSFQEGKIQLREKSLSEERNCKSRGTNYMPRYQGCISMYQIVSRHNFYKWKWILGYWHCRNFQFKNGTFMGASR